MSQKISILLLGGNTSKAEVSSLFVNADTTTVDGLKSAKKFGLVQSGKVDTIYTPLIYEANELFDQNHQGRLFTVFRHPIERAISMFKYLQYVSVYQAKEISYLSNFSESLFMLTL
jgi:hypothetical protein